MDQRRNGIRNRKRAKRRRQRLFARITAIVCIVLVICAGGYGITTVIREHQKQVKLEKEEQKKIEAQNLAIEREKKKVQVTLSMVGDVLTHGPVLDSGKQSDGSYNYDHLFQQVKPFLEERDIRIANQEVILGGREIGLSTYPSFNAPHELGDSLVAGGFNTILHATNHTMDRGGKAVDLCMNFWKTKHPETTVLGIHETQQDRDDNIYIYEKNGFKIAILNYTYGTNGIPLPADRPYLVNLLDKEKVDADLRKANELADYVIVCPHWGTEYVFEATEEQKEWTNFFLQRGVDLVIGTHPHVIEPVEWVEDGENKMLVFYSLGNYISRQDKWYRMVGAMANVTLEKDADGVVTVKEYGVDPLVTHIANKNEYTTYFLRDYTEELAGKNRIRQLDSSFTLEKCKELCEQVFGELYQEEF